MTIFPPKRMVKLPKFNLLFSSRSHLTVREMEVERLLKQAQLRQKEVRLNRLWSVWAAAPQASCRFPPLAKSSSSSTWWSVRCACWASHVPTSPVCPHAHTARALTVCVSTCALRFQRAVWVLPAHSVLKHLRHRMYVQSLMIVHCLNVLRSFSSAVSWLPTPTHAGAQLRTAGWHLSL